MNRDPRASSAHRAAMEAEPLRCNQSESGRACRAVTAGLPINRIPDRVLLAYGHEEHTTAVHLYEALARLCEVHAIGPGNEPPRAWIGSDLPLVWVESGVLWYPQPELLRTRLSVGWIVDTHIRLYWRARLGSVFDHAFLAQRQAVTTARRLGADASWLPLAAPDYLLPPRASFSKRGFDVAFVGSVRPGSPRARVLEYLRERFNMAPYGRYQTPAEMMTTYANARVVVNIPVRRDLNMRAFEAPAAGAFLVTPPIDGLGEVLPAGLYGVVGGGLPSDFADAVARALDLDDLPERADAASSVVREAHTYRKRAEVILHVLAGIQRGTHGESSRARALAVAHTRAGQHEEIGALDALPKIERLLWRAGAGIVSRVRGTHALYHARDGSESL